MDNLCDILEHARAFIDFNEGSFRDKESMQYQKRGPLFYPLHSFHADSEATAYEAKKPVKKRTWKKPKGKPKRPLSAYNIFFQQERKEIISLLPEDNTIRDDGLTDEQRRIKHRKTHGKISFADLARTIAEKWKSLNESEKGAFESRASAEKERYQSELDVWKQTQSENIKTSKSALKKKSKPSPRMTESRRAAVPPESFDDIVTEADSNPESWRASVTPESFNRFEANRTNFLQIMLNTQSLADFQQQVPNAAGLHDFLAPSCLSQILHPQSQSYCPRSTHGSNCGVPLNYQQFVPDVCQMPRDANIDYQCHDPQPNTFLDGTVFEVTSDTTSCEALPDGTSELSLEESFDAFIDNFGT